MLRKCDGLLGPFGEVVREESIDATILDNLHSCLNIRALQAYNQRLCFERIVAAHGFHTSHHGLSNMVAPRDPAKDVDENRLDIWVTHDDLKGKRHGFHGGGAAYVQEVRWLAA